jgi:hypothetical protein
MATKNATLSVTNIVAAMQALPASQSVMIRGDRGIGKSSILGKQMAHWLGEKLGRSGPVPTLDYRLGQRTPGDVIGMPVIKDGTTVFAPPAEMKRACHEPCVMFFDELNRGQDEVMQAVFQVCLDRVLPDGTPLHPETRVYAAINLGGPFTVQRLDPALLDRFWTADMLLKPEEWLAWARGPGKILPVVCDFIAANPTCLFPADRHEPDSVQPTPRSWEFVSTALRTAGVADGSTDPLFYALTVGFVGNEVASTFVRFAGESAAKRVTGKDVLTRYSADPSGTYEYAWETRDKAGATHQHRVTRPLGKVQATVRGMSADGLNDLIEQVGSEVSKMMGPPPADQLPVWGTNLQWFCEDLPAELRMLLWAKCSAGGADAPDAALWYAEHLAPGIIEGALGVPLGEEGIGVAPNIPSGMNVG